MVSRLRSKCTCKDKHLFTELKSLNSLQCIGIKTGNGTIELAIGINTIKIPTQTNKGETQILRINNILHTLNIIMNIISNMNFKDKEVHVHTGPNYIDIDGKGTTVISLEIYKRLFFLRQVIIKTAFITIIIKDLNLWHYYIKHLAKDKIAKLTNSTEGVTSKSITTLM